MNDALQALVEQEVGKLNYEVVELRHGGSRSRPTIDVRIERRDGKSITVDDCALVSRAVQPVLDSSGLVAERYVLEVSSPGVERPLRRVADWRRFVGRHANVLSPAIGGRYEMEIVEVVGDPGSEAVVLRSEKGKEHRVPVAEIKEARLAFHW
jgi:ribosome maturation factor RimP